MMVIVMVTNKIYKINYLPRHVASTAPFPSLRAPCQGGRCASAG